MDLMETLRRKYPEMTPVKTIPFLGRLNGCGFTVYGKRDEDPETASYVKTYVFTMLFIPIWACAAYRVANAENGGWYFLGKVPVTGLAKIWNQLLIACILVLGITWGLDSYNASPERRIAKDLKEAIHLRESGRTLPAIHALDNILRRYKKLPKDNENLRKAKILFVSTVKDQLGGTKAGESVEVIKIIKPYTKRKELFSDFSDMIRQLVEKYRKSNPEEAYRIYILSGDKAENKLETQKDLLTNWSSIQPENPAPVVELALMSEQAGDSEQCYQLLLPQKDRLKESEGARILGELLLDRGEEQAAYPLLYAYLGPKMKHFHKLEQDFNFFYNKRSDALFKILKDGKASQRFYDKYDRATEQEQQELVNNYINSRIVKMPEYIRRDKELAEATYIVPYVLDLGILQVHRASEMTNLSERKKELDRAKKTFLTIGSYANETDTYRMFLGQVHYWLGEIEEGERLLGQLLESHHRDYNTLLSIAEIYRNVGEFAKAKALIEGAYEKGRKKEEKYAAASFRALLYTDVDDEIQWLKKADPINANVQNNLHYALGRKAAALGQKSKARTELQKAIAGYSKLPQTGTALNNTALAEMTLYSVTGRIRDFEKAAENMEQAVALNPSNSIQISNTIHILIQSAVLRTFSDRIDFADLQNYATLSIPGFLSHNEKEYRSLLQRIAAHKHFASALKYLDKACLLAPKSKANAFLYQGIYRTLHDTEHLVNFKKRIEKIQFDHSDDLAMLKELQSPEKQKETKEILLASIAEAERLFSKKGSSTLTQAIGESTYISSKITQNRLFGTEPDLAKLTAMMKDIVRKAPCLSTLALEEEFFFFKLHLNLMENAPEYRELTEKTKWSLSTPYLISFLLEQKHPLSQTILSNPYFIKAQDLQREFEATYPSLHSVVTWAQERWSDPATGKQCAASLKADENYNISTTMQLILNPTDAETVLKNYWLLKMNKQDSKANNLYRKSVKLGLSLPKIIVTQVPSE
jgi:hypothetical protein